MFFRAWDNKQKLNLKNLNWAFKVLLCPHLAVAKRILMYISFLFNYVIFLFILRYAIMCVVAFYYDLIFWLVSDSLFTARHQVLAVTLLQPPEWIEIFNTMVEGTKNSTYKRQSIFRPIWIVAPIHHCLKQIDRPRKKVKKMYF